MSFRQVGGNRVLFDCRVIELLNNPTERTLSDDLTYSFAEVSAELERTASELDSCPAGGLLESSTRCVDKKHVCEPYAVAR